MVPFMYNARLSENAVSVGASHLVMPQLKRIKRGRYVRSNQNRR